jgi:excisionase family DNA binding protein
MPCYVSSKRGRKVERQVRPNDDDLLFTRDEARLKLKVSLTTLDGLIREGKLQVVRIGNKRKFIRPDAIAAYLKSVQA